MWKAFTGTVVTALGNGGRQRPMDSEDWLAFAIGGAIGYACSLLSWWLAIPAAIAYGTIIYFRDEHV